MQWVLRSRSARRPSAVRDALWFPQVNLGPPGSRGEKWARIPSLIKRL
jgi:hypothetical protein